MKLFVLPVLSFVYSFAFAQKAEIKLASAVKQLEADTQMKHALFSLYVVDSKTGKVIFDKNSQVGLAPASCMKVFTSAAAMELLGKDYRYKTSLGYNGKMEGNTLNGDLFIIPSGDPTLGSWRWDGTKAEAVLQNILTALKGKNIRTITGDLVIDDSRWETQATPRGWIWEDIGNYYGAGARGLNWHENQYDILLKPGKNAGDSVEIIIMEPALQGTTLINELKTGKAGSGDNSIIYLPEDGSMAYLRGTVPAGNKIFKISGSLPNATSSFAHALEGFLQQNNIQLKGSSKTGIFYFMNKEKMPATAETLMSLYSPTLDSMNYWFLQKSINLYGEALVKTIAYDKAGFGATDTGINIIRDFWAKNGIEKSALHMLDGSGLSPANRVTANALVTVMQYAKKQSWYSSFYNALPEQNGIKMKSGYIGGVRSYTGYIKSGSGAEYTFSFIINNFDGNPVSVREKMWKLLDILKAP